LAAHSFFYCFFQKAIFFFIFWHYHGEVNIPFHYLFIFCSLLHFTVQTVETRKTSFASRAPFLSQFLALFHAIAIARRAVLYTTASTTSQPQIGEKHSCFPRTSRLFGLDVLRKSKAQTYLQRGDCTE
jgi:hypothetical protein